LTLLAQISTANRSVQIELISKCELFLLHSSVEESFFSLVRLKFQGLGSSQRVLSLVMEAGRPCRPWNPAPATTRVLGTEDEHRDAEGSQCSGSVRASPPHPWETSEHRIRSTQAYWVRNSCEVGSILVGGNLCLIVMLLKFESYSLENSSNLKLYSCFSSKLKCDTPTSKTISILTLA
jgi:hypothetical protein